MKKFSMYIVMPFVQAVNNKTDRVLSWKKKKLAKIMEAIKPFRKRHMPKGIEKELKRQISKKQKYVPQINLVKRREFIGKIKQNFVNIGHAFRDSAINFKDNIKGLFKRKPKLPKIREQPSEKPLRLMKNLPEVPKPAKKESPSIKSRLIIIYDNISSRIQAIKNSLIAYKDRRLHYIRSRSAKIKSLKLPNLKSLKSSNLKSVSISKLEALRAIEEKLEEDIPKKSKQLKLRGDSATKTILQILHNLGIIKTEEERRRIKLFKIQTTIEEERSKQTSKLIKQMLKEIKRQTWLGLFEQADSNYRAVIKAYNTLPVTYQLKLKFRIINEYNNILKIRGKVLGKY